MKGWRPSAWHKLETGSGLVKRANSCRTSDRSACLFREVLGPGSMTRDVSWTPGSLFALNQAPRPTSRTDRAHASPILETAPALHLPRETGGPRNEDETERQKGRTSSATPARWVAFKAESAHKRKKGCGGQRNSLIRLDSAKEIQGFSLRKFGWALLDGAQIWPDLGFGLGFAVATPLRKLVDRS